MNDWFEIVGFVLFALLVWFGLGWVIAQLDTPASGEREAPASRVAPTGTGSAQGPRSYRDAYTDHRDHGDEDPPLYKPGRPKPSEAQIERLERAILEDEMKRAKEAIDRQLPDDAGPVGLGVPPKWDPSILRPSERFTEEIVKKCKKVLRGLARPPHVKHRRDGIRLGDEASAALLKDIFGDPPPA